MTEGIHAQARWQGRVRQDQVQPVHSQLGQQAVELPFLADHLEGLIPLQGGLQQMAGHHLGHGIRNADPQLQRPARTARLPHDLIQLRPQVEDVLGITEGQLPGIGQLQAASTFVEQLTTKVILQQLNLTADGLGRDMQKLSGLDHATVLGDGPEIEQVLVIHFEFCESFCKLNLIYTNCSSS